MAADLLGTTVRREVALDLWCTYRVGGAAALFVEVDSEAELTSIASATAQSGVPTLVLGKGSNLLVADTGFDGLVLHLGPSFSELAVEGNLLIAGGAAMLPVVARFSVREGLEGFEWAVGVPGTVGGAVRMNAGGHGSDINESLVQVSGIDLATGVAFERSRDELALGYRSSNIASSQVVTSASFRLLSTEDPNAAGLSDIVRWRRENQPGGQNAGSVFANPDGFSAGKLIDQAGLKGFRIGSAQVSEKHANFIQAEPGGTAQDVFDLIRHIQQEIVETTGLWLTPENHLVGFDGGTKSPPSDDQVPS